MERTGVTGLIIIVGLWLAMLSPALSADAFKVAVMDQQLVIEHSKAGKRALEELKSYSSTRQKIINSDDQELKELEQTIQDPKLTDSAKQEKQNQFQAKLEAYQRRLADFNREIQQKQREMVAEYSKKVQAAAQVVGEKNGYMAVIDKGNEAVMKILFDIDKKGQDPVDYVKEMLAAKKKVPGFGHRVYTTEDPRATHLRKMSHDLGEKDGKPKWYDMSKKIEDYMNHVNQKKLNANVDFYSASTYTTLGIDLDLFTPIFAISRISGWTAHIIEQHDDNRLIRPRADYTGPQHPAPYTPIEQR